MELNLKNVLDKMGVQYATSESELAAFQKTQARRRLLKKEMEEKVAQLTKELVSKLSGISSVEIPQRDPENEKVYKTLKEVTKFRVL